VTTWKLALSRALRSGSAASVLSAAALAICGKLERGTPAGPLNGPSQWIWGERAARRQRASLRETAVGYSIHHGVSIGWATLHERHVATLVEGRSMPARIAAGLATASFAYLMDFGVARGRLRPGFEKQLSRKSLIVVYSAFALGLAIGAGDRTRHRQHSSGSIFSSGSSAGPLSTRPSGWNLEP
jgi:hypothetical protein